MKMSLVQPSLDTIILTRVRVSSTNPLGGRVAEATVATWDEFQQRVVERNITFSHMERFCILQGSVVTFFRCGAVGKGVTLRFLLR